MTSEYVKNLIDKAYEEKTSFLDLGNCGLREVPEEIVKLAPWLKRLKFGIAHYQDSKYVNSVNKRGRNILGDTSTLMLLQELIGLTNLDISNNEVGEKGAESISHLSGLTNLNIGSNRIGDKGAESISHLSDLTSLEISQNRISDKGAESISRLSGLTNLEINQNSIGDKGAELISRLSGLTSLYIWSNKIGDKGAKSVSRLSGLTNLDVWSNSIGEKGAESISRLSGLTNLDIGFNSIGEKGAESISRLSDLTKLSIGFNSIGEKGVELISRLSGLAKLSIGSNSIGDKGAELISRLSGLTDLDIGSNTIGDKGAESISRLSGLTKLNIGFNSIGEKGAESISRLSGLTNLDIGFNSIGEKGAESISRLSGLTNLNIGSNSIGEKGAESISRLSGLTKLNIGFNSIGDKGAESISRLNGLTNLDIGSNNIGDKGAESISRLSGLTNLDIGSNSISDKGAESISHLSGLTNLDISNNEVGDKGAESISRLSGLTNLSVWSNSIGEKGAESISRLSGLTILNAWSNNIGEKGAESISRLSDLMNLNIGSNSIGNKGVESISRLSGLTILDIRNNKIYTPESINALLEKLVNLTSLSISDNEIQGLPPELGNDIASLRGYFSSVKKVPNTLVKMILIGNTTAGKSSLADFLINKQFDEKRKSTHGIKLWRWYTGKSAENIQVNIWDLGGQDYYHATHNLFLDDKTLFLLLQTAKEKHMEIINADEKQYLSANYWLGNIRSVNSNDSAVWFIQSKSSGEPLDYLDSTLVNKYRVTRQYKIDIKEAYDNIEPGVNDFNYFLNNLVPELKSLAKNELPVSWVEIRDKHLPEWRKELALTSEQFREKAEKALNGNPAHKIDLINSWDGLIPYLKGAGEIVHFSDKGQLSDTIFLSAESLTSGIYSLLSQKALENKGEFTLTDLTKADQKKGELYLQVLLAFEIIFEKPGDPGTYIAPQYLPENPHTRHFQQLIKVAFVIRFPDYMSRSLITQFLVKYAGGSADNYFWKYGAFFKLNDLNLFVRIDADLQKIYVHVEEGHKNNKFRAMKEIFLFFTAPKGKDIKAEDLQQRRRLESATTGRGLLSEWALSEAVPGEIELSLDDKDFASVKEIRNAIEQKAYRIKSKQGGYIEFNAILNQLLNTNATTPKRIFLSYSHKDEEYKKELDVHFAGLKRSGKVETWNCQKILPGDNWDKSIEEALINADIAILLLSADFMASDYIWNVEIPKAKENGVTIVPVFIRHCDFSESVFEIYKNQGLPADCKWIISGDFQYRDKGYLEVIDGIKKIVG